MTLEFCATECVNEQLEVMRRIDLVRLLCDEGPAVPNNRGHFVGGCVNHHVGTHQRLRLCASTQISSEFRFEVELFDPMVGSFLHLYGEPVESFRRVRRVQQTKGWTLSGSDIYVITIEP